MRAVLVLALAVSVTSWAAAATIDPAEAWRPMGPFIGTWKGTRSGGDGAAKVTRIYAAASTNHHLEITESGGGHSKAVCGMVSLDLQRQVLVLRQFNADGSASDLALDSSASNGDQLVFATPESVAGQTRITYARKGAKTFIERVEHAEGGQALALVSETKFVRKD